MSRSIDVQQVTRIDDTLERLIQLASSDGTVAAKEERAWDELSVALEDCLYSLTGMLLDFFRHEDERHIATGAKFDRLLVARRQVTQSLYRLLEGAGTMRTCTDVTPEALLEDIESLVCLFRDYRATSINLASVTTRQYI